ncbi:hypothetical protein CFE70_000635 [Pyrenophora teres f. teres 0-1]
MSSALAKASPLKPEIRLAQAVSDPHDVMQLTAEVHRHTSKKFRSACFGLRFTNFLHGVQQFAALGDIIIGGSQNLMACVDRELNKVDKDYWMRLQWAVENGNGNVLVLLLQAGKIDLNARDSDGSTPLMWAALRGHRDTVETLLSVGKADVEAKDSSGSTPLKIARSSYEL